jgi:signal transduction histidine kinase
MLAQWLGGIAGALWISYWHPSWDPLHLNIWAAFLLGGLITAYPLFLAFYIPGSVATRHVIAFAQMLMSGLLIHLSGGRVETHFHVFGSLALMAFYRDWKVLLTASLTVIADHFVRGLFWPGSVYGVDAVSPWRAVEHAGWIGFEVAVLMVAIRQSRAEMKEMALRQAILEVTNSHIEEKVQQRTVELKETVEQLETFCHSVSHDFRAPLRAMQGFAQILSNEYGGALDAVGRDYAAKIVNSSRQMNALISDLLEYTRVSRAHMPLESVRVIEAVEQALALLAEEVNAKEARIVIAPDLGVVRAHKSTLVQVLMNLIANGLKFTPRGKRPEIHVHANIMPEDRVRVWVEDNGIGIDSRDFDRLFGMFQRVSPTFPGTGIGLALVRKGIERMGGKVSLESEVGKGSRFWIELPGEHDTERTVHVQAA